jgi:hypothetical protein
MPGGCSGEQPKQVRRKESRRQAPSRWDWCSTHQFKLPPKWRRKKAEKEKCFAAFAGGGGRVMGGGYEVLMLM